MSLALNLGSHFGPTPFSVSCLYSNHNGLHYSLLKVDDREEVWAQNGCPDSKLVPKDKYHLKLLHKYTGNFIT